MRGNIDAMKKELVGKVVYTPYNKKTYTISDIDFTTEITSKFTRMDPKTKESKEVTYKEYYKMSYDINDIKEQPFLLAEVRRTKAIVKLLP
jgi:hypothetical protein